MKKNLRAGFLLWAGLAMVFSSIGGCASSGASVGGGAPREFQHPSPETLMRIPEGTPVRVELLSGRTVEGSFISYSAAEASVSFSMEQVGNALSDEFKEEGHIYRIPEEKIITLTILDPPDQAKTSGIIVGVAVVLFLAAVAYGSALSGAIGN